MYCHTDQVVSTMNFSSPLTYSPVEYKVGCIQQYCLIYCHPPPAIVHNRPQSLCSSHALPDHFLIGLASSFPSHAGVVLLPPVSPIEQEHQCNSTREALRAGSSVHIQQCNCWCIWANMCPQDNAVSMTHPG